LIAIYAGRSDLGDADRSELDEISTLGLPYRP
jgi:hypothetical protein